MDLRTVVIVTTFALVTAGSNSTETPANSGATTSLPNSSSCDGACPPAATEPSVTAPSSSSSSSPILGLLTVRWSSKCEGHVFLVPYFHFKHSLPVCFNLDTHFQSIINNVCLTKEGCQKVSLNPGEIKEGYKVTEKGANKESSCEIIRVTCTGKELPDVKGQLQAYKVVTALLCCVLLVLLLIRFTRPTVKALQKRLSDKRQTRWIGPTQSALERLTIGDIHDPSYNRNSGYSF
ncbi:uncharacterized protein cd5 isoform X2 [Odontesthes bonariensis]|uniref:uncharacterized protein cd5 isoform X2 n=1 Tax=Odontesthes bonariensis TaxID=219752 RepID=UPI003F58361A